VKLNLSGGGGKWGGVIAAVLVSLVVLSPASAAESRKSASHVRSPLDLLSSLLKPAPAARRKPPRPSQAAVPKPQAAVPRPQAAAPGVQPSLAMSPAAKDPGIADAAVLPGSSSCRRALGASLADAPSIPDIHGPGACGGVDLVRLEAVVLPDRSRVAIRPPAILRCEMATAVVAWVRGEAVKLTATMGAALSELDNFDSYECRGRNRVAGAQLSEHGLANALDVRALRLADGRRIRLTDAGVAHQLRQQARESLCSRFTTVLGPGSDGYHEDHIHLDLRMRHHGFRICHWEVRDASAAAAGAGEGAGGHRPTNPARNGARDSARRHPDKPHPDGDHPKAVVAPSAAGGNQAGKQ